MPRLLENWIKTYREYTEYTEAPSEFHFWTAVSTICAALRRKVQFDQEYYRWRPNMYIIFVAPPGIATKSTTMNIGLNFLRDLPGVKLGPNAITWQALTQALSESTEMILMPDGLLHPMSCLTFASSEFGTLVDPHDKRMMDILVDFWDGNDGNWEKRTKFSGNDNIPNPWVNIIACTTPSWLTENMPRVMIGGGFTSRCVFVFGEKKRQFIAYPKRHMKPGWIASLREKLAHDLEQISMLKGDFELTEAAYLWGEQWYEKHWTTRPQGMNDSQFVGYMARKQGHIHKLAMVLSVAEKDDLLIDAPTLKLAADIMTDMEQDMPNVFSQIGTTSEMDIVVRIVETVQAHKKILVGTLYRMFMRQLQWQDFKKAVESAKAGGYVTEEIHVNNAAYLIAVDKEAVSA